MQMLRRTFLAQLAAGAASIGIGESGAFAYSKKKHPAHSESSKFDRIAISTWSLHNYFRTTRADDFAVAGPLLALLDVPEIVVDKYKVRHFEFCTTHFPSTEHAFLQELKYVLAHTRSTIVNMPVDIDECGAEGTFSDPEQTARSAALEAVKSRTCWG